MPADFPDISSLVRAYFKAFDERNREATKALLADEFRFTSSFDDAIDRAAFFERCWPTATPIKITASSASSPTETPPSSPTSSPAKTVRLPQHRILRRPQRQAHPDRRLLRANYVHGEFVPEG